MKISCKFLKQAAVYEHFGKLFLLSFDRDQLERQYVFESTGPKSYQEKYGEVYKINNYGLGKQWTNWHITEWKADIEFGILTKDELFSWYAADAVVLEYIQSALGQ